MYFSLFDMMISMITSQTNSISILVLDDKVKTAEVQVTGQQDTISSMNTYIVIDKIISNQT